MSSRKVTWRSAAPAATAAMAGGLLLSMVVLPAATATAATTTTAGVASYYTPTTPTRLVDTRSGSGFQDAGDELTPGGSINIQVTGTTVPAGATAAILNVTAVSPTAKGYFSLYPEGSQTPGTAGASFSNLNFAPKETVANLVTVPLSSTGEATLYNYAGSANAVVDVDGYYSSTATAAGAGLYNPVTPFRALGGATLGAALTSGETTPVTVTGGSTGVPAGATSVVVNLTAAHETEAGYLTAFPAAATTTTTTTVTPPTASNLNFIKGQVVANRATVPVGAAGAIDIYNYVGSTDVDVDIDGYYTAAGGTGSTFTPLATPVRVTGTAAGVGTSIASDTTTAINVTTGDSAIPTDAAAIAGNVTVESGDAPGYVTVSPIGTTEPAAGAATSDVNFGPNQDVPNFTIVPTSTATATAGEANFFNYTGDTVQVLVDAFGYFGASTTPTSNSVTASNIKVNTTTTAAGTGTALTDGQTESITATVKDGAGGSTVAGDQVMFTVTSPGGGTCGTVSPTTATTNSSGVATTTYTAPAAATGDATSCTVTAAEADFGESGSETIAQTAPAGTATLTASPTTIAANGTSTSTLTFTPTPGTPDTDINGVVTFNKTGAACGATSAPSGTTGTSGTTAVTATYTSTTTPGFCSITATDTPPTGSAFTSGAVSIDQTNPALTAATLTITSPTSNPDDVTNSLTAITISGTVTDGGVAVAAGDPVDFTVSGTGCTTTPAAVATVTGGTFSTSYVAPANSACTITATEGDTGATASIAIDSSAAAASAYLTPPGSGSSADVPVAIGTTQGFTVTVAGDTGTTDTATFSTSGTACGSFAAATEPITTITSGAGTSASDAYTASSTVGFCTITATTATGGTATATVDQDS